MAPTRRKAASKAAMAAAARQKWRVGDLVLAKVKGFPAWPATVSEPEKWGYSSDWKKVLVHFFGTQQIAFCNPADVESFTEEKKQSLLGKRHGKSADFVRAVQEIIDSHEKLKKLNQQDNLNSGNDGNSVDLQTNVGTRIQSVTLETAKDMQCSANDVNEPMLPIEISLAMPEENGLLDNEVSLNKSMDTALVTKTPFPVVYSLRKRSGVIQPKCSSLQRSRQAIRRSRSSSRVESRRMQNLMISHNVGSKNDEDSNLILDESLRQNKRVRKSPHGSDCDDVNSDAFISNGSIEDSGSEIVTVDSDSYSLTEGSTETGNEYLEGDVELTKVLDLHVTPVVMKRKRQPNRKRVTKDATEKISTLDRMAGAEAVNDISLHTSNNACEKITDMCCKEDGDKHLPLVKRARVRMGKSSLSEEEAKNCTDAEERNLKEATVKESTQKNISSMSADDSLTYKDSPLVNEASDNLLPIKSFSQIQGNESHPCNDKKDQQVFCIVDGEAALPPSKRLHRALEAMSANAAEEGQASAEMSISVKASINGGCISPNKRCPELPEKSVAEDEIRLQNNSSFGNKYVQADESASVNPKIVEESAKPTVEIDFFCLSKQNSNSYKLDVNDLSVSSSDSHVTAPEAQIVRTLSPNMGREHNNGSNEKKIYQSLSPKDEGTDNYFDTSYSKSKACDKHVDAVEQTRMSISPSPRSESNVLKSFIGDPGCDTKSLVPLLEANGESNDLLEMKKVSCKVSEKAQSYISCSNDPLSDKNASGVRSSPSITDGGDSCIEASSPHTSICHVTTSDSSNFPQNNSSCSPDVHLPKRSLVAPVVEMKLESSTTGKPKYHCKNVEGHAALSSFEGMIGIMTRTKESIGRATRAAIDCAKSGLGHKVVEALIRNLDSESSFYRKLDIFFLVDSITQCSRNLKGDVAGVYPQAIQSVLSRLLLAVAPPGPTAYENRKQCIKVLKLWLQRGVLAESVIRHHIRELESLSGSSSSGAYSRRSARTERSLDDPLRDMEGMLVDEYGSNSSLQLPGLCMPCMLKNEGEGSDSDGGIFEAVTPEHELQVHEEHGTMPILAKHRHILEDVDGELEMEDVAPPCEVEMGSSCSTGILEPAKTSHEHHFPLPVAPPLPHEGPPSSPPLPSSPPPSGPSLPHLPPVPPFSGRDPYRNAVEPKYFSESNNMRDGLAQAGGQQSHTSRANQRVCDSGNFPAHESRDHRLQNPVSASHSLNNFPVRPFNDAHQADGGPLYNKGYPLPHLHHNPSNQFYQARGDRKPHREGPPSSYSNRFHYRENMDRENLHNNHERMRHSSYEFRESWRFPGPFTGPYSSDRCQSSYESGPYNGPPCEPHRLPGRGLRFPPREVDYRNSVSSRPPYNDQIPISKRGPSYWRPR